MDIKTREKAETVLGGNETVVGGDAGSPTARYQPHGDVHRNLHYTQGISPSPFSPFPGLFFFKTTQGDFWCLKQQMPALLSSFCSGQK